MKVVLEFHGAGRATVLFGAETDAERAILGFLAEGKQHYVAHQSYSYRPGAIDQLRLEPTTVGTVTPGERDAMLELRAAAQQVVDESVASMPPTNGALYRLRAALTAQKPGP